MRRHYRIHSRFFVSGQISDRLLERLPSRIWPALPRFGFERQDPFYRFLRYVSPGRNWEQIRNFIATAKQMLISSGAHAGISVGPMERLTKRPKTSPLCEFCPICGFLRHVMPLNQKKPQWRRLKSGVLIIFVLLGRKRRVLRPKSNALYSR